MIQCAVDLDQLLKSYLKSHNCLFRKAPMEINNMMHNVCGIALRVPVPIGQASEGLNNELSDKV